MTSCRSVGTPMGSCMSCLTLSCSCAWHQHPVAGYPRSTECGLNVLAGAVRWRPSQSSCLGTLRHRKATAASPAWVRRVAADLLSALYSLEASTNITPALQIAILSHTTCTPWVYLTRTRELNRGTSIVCEWGISAPRHVRWRGTWRPQISPSAAQGHRTRRAAFTLISFRESV